MWPDIPLPCFQDFIEIGLGPVTLFPSQSKCRAAPISFPTLAKCISCLKFPRAWFSKEYNWTVRDWWCKGRAKVVENNVMPRWKLVRLRSPDMATHKPREVSKSTLVWKAGELLKPSSAVVRYSFLLVCAHCISFLSKFILRKYRLCLICTYFLLYHTKSKIV